MTEKSEPGAALPAEHAPPDPEIFAALRDLEALVRDFQSTHDYTEWWDNSPEVIRARDILNRESAVGSRPAPAGSPNYEALAIEFNQRPLTFSDGIQLSPAAAVREFAAFLARSVSGVQGAKP